MPQAKNKVALRNFGKLHCRSCTATFVLKSRRVTIRGAQPSARLSKEIYLSEGSPGVSQRALRGPSEGSAGSLRGSAGVRGNFFSGGSDPMLVTLGNCWNLLFCNADVIFTKSCAATNEKLRCNVAKAALQELSGPLRLRVQSRSRRRLRIAVSIAFVFRAYFKEVLDTIAPLSRG